MWKRYLICLLLCLLPLSALAEAPKPLEDELCGTERVCSYDSDTLEYTVEIFQIGELRTKCYVTRLWMAEPGRQIRKATAQWEENLVLPIDMAKTIPEAALVINGSGYVSPEFPTIPRIYPGKSEDYYFTPLGSLTVTNGEIFRNLKGVPYYGLTLEADGLHLCVKEDNEAVLAREPTQTWSFYTGCPLIANHESIVNKDWYFTKLWATRTIIAKRDEHQYVIITAPSEKGLTLTEAVDWLQEVFDPEWAYNLEGGPSSALICRQKGSEDMTVVYGGEREDVDIMAFTE